MSTSPRNEAVTHPSLTNLSLFSRGDLSFLERRRIRTHINDCTECDRQVGLFASSVAELKRQAGTETLTAFEAVADWNALEREMLGNIVVGVAAARCIDNTGQRRSWLPRLALVCGLCALFVAGWATHIPAPQTKHLTSSLAQFIGLRRAANLPNMLTTTPNGIAVRSEGVTFTILHPGSAVVSRSGNSSVAARYIDEDTGQLTINNVYGQ